MSNNKYFNGEVAARAQRRQPSPACPRLLPRQRIARHRGTAMHTHHTHSNTDSRPQSTRGKPQQSHGPAPLSVGLNRLAVSLARRLLEFSKMLAISGTRVIQSLAPYSLANRPASPAYAHPSIFRRWLVYTHSLPSAPSVPSAREPLTSRIAERGRMRGRMNELSAGVIVCDCMEGPQPQIVGGYASLQGAELRENLVVEPGQSFFFFTRGKGLDLPHLPNCHGRCWRDVLIELIVPIGAMGTEERESVCRWPRTWGLVRLYRSIKYKLPGRSGWRLER